MTVTIRNMRAYLCVAIATTGGGCLLYYAMPSRRYHLVMEDQLVETMTALVFLATFVGAVTLLCRDGVEQRKFVSVLAAMGLLGFLDEMSFGQRLLQFRGIPMWNVRVDGVHDLFEVIRDLLARSPIARWVSLSLMAALCLVCVGVRARLNAWLRRLFQAGRENLAVQFLGVFVLLAAAATMIDVDLIEFGCTTLVEELLEMNAAIALFCSYLGLRDRVRGSWAGESDGQPKPQKKRRRDVPASSATVGNAWLPQSAGRGD